MRREEVVQRLAAAQRRARHQTLEVGLQRRYALLALDLEGARQPQLTRHVRAAHVERTVVLVAQLLLQLVKLGEAPFHPPPGRLVGAVGPTDRLECGQLERVHHEVLLAVLSASHHPPPHHRQRKRRWRIGRGGGRRRHRRRGGDDQSRLGAHACWPAHARRGWGASHGPRLATFTQLWERRAEHGARRRQHNLGSQADTGCRCGRRCTGCGVGRGRWRRWCGTGGAAHGGGEHRHR